MTRLLQYANAPSPIVVILSGMLIVTRFSQLMNAKSPIVVILSGRLIVTRLLQNANAPSPIVVILSGSLIVSRSSQYANALSPIVVILSGSLTWVIWLQFWKALFGITLMPLLIVTIVLSLFHLTLSLLQHQLPTVSLLTIGGHVNILVGALVDPNGDEEVPLTVDVGPTVVNGDEEVPLTVDVGATVENGENVVLKSGVIVDPTGGWVDVDPIGG